MSVTVELKNISSKNKLIFINGEKAGLISKESHAGPNSLDGKSQRFVAWSGNFKWDGKELHLGPTLKISDIIPKVERMISSYESQKNQSLNEAEIADALKGAAIRAVKNVGNRVMYGVGSQFGWGNEAKGRLDLNAASRRIYKDWRQYVGRKGIKGDPSLEDMSVFLKSTYGLKMSPESLSAVAQGEPSSANEKSDEKQDTVDDAEDTNQEKTAVKEHINYTSVNEYNTLKKIFGRGTLFEANEEEDNSSASHIKFSPTALRSFFPKLANLLIDRGMLTVTRNGEVIGRNGRDNSYSSDDGQTDSSDDGQTASARVTKDGSSIDIIKMKKLMTTDGITKNDMALLKKLIKTPGEKSFNAISGDPNASKTMVSLVNALVNSISKGNNPSDIAAQHSITADGHVLDINDFTADLEKHKVTGGDIEKIRLELKTDGKAGLMNILSKHTREAKVIYWLASAALRSISTPETPETPEPPKA